jgi:RNA-binding protein 25
LFQKTYITKSHPKLKVDEKTQKQLDEYKNKMGGEPLQGEYLERIKKVIYYLIQKHERGETWRNITKDTISEDLLNKIELPASSSNQQNQTSQNGATTANDDDTERSKEHQANKMERDKEREREQRRKDREEREYKEREREWELRERDKLYERQKDLEREVEREKKGRERVVIDLEYDDTERRRRSRDYLRKKRDREREFEDDEADRLRELQEEEYKRREEIRREEERLEREREQHRVTKYPNNHHTPPPNKPVQTRDLSRTPTQTISTPPPYEQNQYSSSSPAPDMNTENQFSPSSLNSSQGYLDRSKLSTVAVQFGGLGSTTTDKKKPVPSFVPGFADLESDIDELYSKKKLKLTTLDTHLHQDNERKAKLDQVKSVIEQIPTSAEELFAFPLKWDIIEKHNIVEGKMRPWVTKKIVDYLGEEEKSLIDFILKNISNHVSPQDILKHLSMVLDEEGEVFMLKMWR